MCVCAWVCAPCCVASVGWRAARACIRPRALPHTTVPASAARCSGGVYCRCRPIGRPRGSTCNTQHTTSNSVNASGARCRCRPWVSLGGVESLVHIAIQGDWAAKSNLPAGCASPTSSSIGRPIEHRSTKSTPHIIAALLRHGCVAICFRLARHAETAGVRASRAVIQSVIDTCLGGGSADALG